MNVVIRELTRMAADAGVRSTVAASDKRDLEFPHAELLPVDFSRYLSRDHFLLRERLADAANGWAGRDRPHVARMYRPIGEALLASEGPIIVHDGYLGAAGLETLHRILPGRPLFLWMHNTLSPAYSPREVRRFISLADKVICVSEWIVDSLRRSARSRSVDSRLTAVLNGVDSERFTPAESRDSDGVPSILFVGRMVKDKGPDVLASALGQLHEQGVDFRATFLGSSHPDVPESRYENAVRSQTAAFADKVSFVPFRPNPELPDLYRSHDIMVVPSRFQEPCSLAALEGMASGLATVAARRGGTPEISQGSLLLFDRTDELARSLKELIQDAELRTHWARLARARAEELPWSRSFELAREFISPAVNA